MKQQTIYAEELRAKGFSIRLKSAFKSFWLIRFFRWLFKC